MKGSTMITPKGNLPLPPAVATAMLAAEYQTMVFARLKKQRPDPWLRWLEAPSFETVCEAIEANPEAFFAGYQALREKTG